MQKHEILLVISNFLLIKKTTSPNIVVATGLVTTCNRIALKTKLKSANYISILELILYQYYISVEYQRPGFTLKV